MKTYIRYITENIIIDKESQFISLVHFDELEIRFNFVSRKLGAETNKDLFYFF